MEDKTATVVKHKSPQASPIEGQENCHHFDSGRYEDMSLREVHAVWGK